MCNPVIFQVVSTVASIAQAERSSIVSKSNSAAPRPRRRTHRTKRARRVPKLNAKLRRSGSGVQEHLTIKTQGSPAVIIALSS